MTHGEVPGEDAVGGREGACVHIDGASLAAARRAGSGIAHCMPHGAWSRSGASSCHYSLAGSRTDPRHATATGPHPPRARVHVSTQPHDCAAMSSPAPANLIMLCCLAPATDKTMSRRKWVREIRAMILGHTTAPTPWLAVDEGSPHRERAPPPCRHSTTTASVSTRCCRVVMPQSSKPGGPPPQPASTHRLVHGQSPSAAHGQS